MKKLIIAFLMMAFLPTTLFAHSGGTDGNGCHAGTQQYHCHNDGDGNSSSSSGGSAALGVLAVIGFSWAIWHFYLREDRPSHLTAEKSRTTHTLIPIVKIQPDELESQASIGFKYQF